MKRPARTDAQIDLHLSNSLSRPPPNPGSYQMRPSRSRRNKYRHPGIVRLAHLAARHSHRAIDLPIDQQFFEEIAS